MAQPRSDFPILDFSKFSHDFESFAGDVFRASNEWGFFILTKHGIQNVERMFDLSKSFFSQPEEEKAKFPINNQAIGYDGNKLSSFAASEGLTLGTPAGGILQTKNLPSFWDAGKRQEIEDFKVQCGQLSSAILSCFAVKLGLDQDYFERNHKAEPGNTLKLIRYPRFEKEPENVPRLSEHTDWGSITFVFTSQPGLEVRDPNDQWYEVPIVPDSIIVNIADALSLWTSKALKSTMHRISWANLDIHQDRYSIAYFGNPNYDALLSLDKQTADSEPPLTYGDYYKVRLSLTYSSNDGTSRIDTTDPATWERVKKLSVANSGHLISHQLGTV